MSRSNRGEQSDASLARVSDAMAKQGDGRMSRARSAWTWLLVDVNRWLVVAALAVAVFAVTLAVGLFGPASAREFLIEGTSISDAYIEIQNAIVAVMTIVLAINQLILSPELGPVSRSRQRLDDAMSHRVEIENVADVTVSPTEPAEFLRTVADATRRHATKLGDAVADTDDAELRRHVDDYVDGFTAEVDGVSDALADQRFGRIGMLGAAMHLDTAHDVHRVRRLRNEHAESLSTSQLKAFYDLVDALKLFTISREYFRTLYVRSQFGKFSRAILYTGLPALLVAHYTVGIVGENVLPGATLGVPDLLWFEAAAFAVSSLPVFMIVSYVARLVTLAETSIFIGPFTRGSRNDGGSGDRAAGSERP